LDRSTYVDYKSIAQHIKTARLKKPMTQIMLAEKLTVTPEYVSRLENATTHPSLQLLFQIADVLRVSLAYLLEGSAVNNTNYKLDEFSQLISALSPEKKKTLLEIGNILLKSQF